MSTISIIVPVYNVEAYLERCILSLLRQCYSDLEIILVDDGSTDNSLFLCQQYARQDARIKLVQKANGGLSSARNAGLDVATGGYVSFVDSDDWVAPETYQRMAELIEQYSPDMVRFGYRKMMNGSVIEQCCLPYDTGLYTGESLRCIQLDTISNEFILDYGRQRILSAWGAVFRRSLLEDCRLRFVSERKILNEDYLFILQTILAVKSLYVCNGVFYHYDTRTNSLSTCYRTNMYERKQHLYMGYCNALPEKSPEVESRLRNFYIDCIYDCIVNECNSARPAREAVQEIKRLLGDEYLQRCLRLNRSFAVSKKTQGICFLMRNRMAIGVYAGYRFFKKRKKAGMCNEIRRSDTAEQSK